jgi:hypothetical protein
MSLEQLLKVRFFYPGVFAFSAIFFIFKQQLPDDNPLNNYQYYVVCLAISAFYEVFQIRELIWTRLIKARILNCHIKNALLSISRGKYEEHKELTNADIIIGLCRKNEKTSYDIPLRCFYACIDNSGNQSLKEKRTITMHIGAIITCQIDTLILSVICIPVSIIYGLTVQNQNIYALLTLFLSIILIMCISLFASVKQHFIVTKSQLDIINKDAKCLEIVKREYKVPDAQT